MEKFLSHSAKFLFGYMIYEIYNYYKFTKYESMLKQCPNIDLSYEKIEDGIVNRNVMIATSINKINYNKNQNYFYIKSMIEGFDERNNILKVSFRQNLNYKII
jgi:hypothetical protein